MSGIDIYIYFLSECLFVYLICKGVYNDWFIINN